MFCVDRMLGFRVLEKGLKQLTAAKREARTPWLAAWRRPVFVKTVLINGLKHARGAKGSQHGMNGIDEREGTLVFSG